MYVSPVCSSHYVLTRCHFLQWMAICGGAVGSAVDLTIASTLCLELYQARTTFAKWALLYYCTCDLLTDGKYRTREMLSMLSMYIITSGLLTTCG